MELLSRPCRHGNIWAPSTEILLKRHPGNSGELFEERLLQNQIQVHPPSLNGRKHLRIQLSTKDRRGQRGLARAPDVRQPGRRKDGRALGLHTRLISQGRTGPLLGRPLKRDSASTSPKPEPLSSLWHPQRFSQCTLPAPRQTGRKISTDLRHAPGSQEGH